MGRRPPNRPEIYQEFIREVHFAGKKGVSQSSLTKKIVCDRTSIYRAAIKAEKRRLVRIIRKGQRTTYFSTEKIILDPALAALLQGRSAFRKIIEGSTKKTIDFKVLFACPEKMTGLELALLNFLIRAGLLVTYSLLESMGRGNRIIAEIYSGKDRRLSDDLKDALILEWIKNSLTSIIPLLPQEFKEVLYKPMEIYPHGYDEQIKFMQKRPKFAIERDIAQKAFNVLEKLFPSEIVALCRISEGLPDAIEFEKQYIESAKTANSKRDTTIPS